MTTTPPQINITIPIVFYHGVQEIADFLGYHERTARRLLQEGKIPAKKDEAGRWVLSNLDYLLSLQA